jgi:Creatinine amidohydrolase
VTQFGELTAYEIRQFAEQACLVLVPTGCTEQQGPHLPVSFDTWLVETIAHALERIRRGIATLQASGRKVTAESLKQVTHDLEPGFAGLSFQVISRNPRAYALYREAADAFNPEPTADKQPTQQTSSADSGVGPRASRAIQPLQRLGNGTW